VELFEENVVLGMLSEVVSEGILIVDADQKIVGSNSAANQLFGYSKRELEGRPMDILIPRRVRSGHRKDVDTFIGTGRARPMGPGLDLWGLRKDGDEFPLEISLNPFKIGDKKYVMALIVDVSERKKAEQTISYWYRIFDESLNEIYVFDPENLLLVNVNRGAQANLGYTMEELHRMTVLDIKPDMTEGEFRKLIAPLSGNKSKKVVFESIHQRKDGSRYPVELHLQNSSIGKRKVLVSIGLDITERRTYTQQLENKVEERTAQLREALKAEKKLNELKTKFLSMVSHEFKTPLASILTSTSLLGRYTRADQQERRDKHIETIKSKVKYLDNILSDFLSMERLESGVENYTIGRFELEPLIDELVHDSTGQLKAGQSIRPPSDLKGIVLEFDQKILALSLSNLVNNAIKYSPEQTEIIIGVTPWDKGIQIEVSDRGLGIPLEDQPFIFQRYYRASNVLTVQGTGIGLNIVQQHLHNLGGELSFESRPGEGSTFRLKIPHNIT